MKKKQEKKLITIYEVKMSFKKVFKKFIPAHKFPQKKLVVVIPSYNNEEWYKKNLDSVFNQEYENYRVIYIDDASTDNTPEGVQKYIKNKRQEQRFTFIKNSFKEGATANRYKGSRLCEDDEIVLILDGDDWFAHNKVMQIINKTYSCDDIWLTYGQFIRWPSGKVGQCKKLPQNYNYRQMKHWYTSALRTYYAWLFKKVNFARLKSHGLTKKTLQSLYWLRIYSFIFSMLTWPTVSTKKPSLQKLSPQ